MKTKIKLRMDREEAVPTKIDPTVILNKNIILNVKKCQMKQKKPMVIALFKLTF